MKRNHPHSKETERNTSVLCHFLSERSKKKKKQLPIFIPPGGMKSWWRSWWRTTCSISVFIFQKNCWIIVECQTYVSLGKKENEKIFFFPKAWCSDWLESDVMWHIETHGIFDEKGNKIFDIDFEWAFDYVFSLGACVCVYFFSTVDSSRYSQQTFNKIGIPKERRKHKIPPGSVPFLIFHPVVLGTESHND